MGEQFLVWNGDGLFWRENPIDGGGWVNPLKHQPTKYANQEAATDVASHILGYVVSDTYPMADQVAKEQHAAYKSGGSVVPVVVDPNPDGPPDPRSDGGAAFARNADEFDVRQNGMSKREYFAAAALTGLLANLGTIGSERNPKEVANVMRFMSERSYQYADAMLAASTGG